MAPNESYRFLSTVFSLPRRPQSEPRTSIWKCMKTNLTDIYQGKEIGVAIFEASSIGLQIRMGHLSVWWEEWEGGLRSLTHTRTTH